ncbi:Rha family transcriptional regulator [Salmonella enterica]|nr:Rha family transcriptional regulator [Salmonella enterica]EDR7170452.1 Rha family transcriptional regulator [Salmonella enterica subsp. houtenae]EHB3807235.1 Rha family transcriptional regulator [Salmonella enterica subsp. enterica serovar Bonariensis]EHQ1840956.1 Rha family transcriptional regulator [Salmonella enterica subsp. enterica serovar Saintpaul]
MTDSISTVLPEVKIAHGQAVTTSIAIANFFGKQHKHVLEKIRNLDCSPVFMTANFSAVAMETQAGFDSREIEAYEITKNGFIFLVMGFTGKKAASFKEAYIAEFDRMEAELLQTGLNNNYQFDGRLLLTIKNGIITDSKILTQDEYVATIPAFIDIARAAHYIVVHEDDVAPLINAFSCRPTTPPSRPKLPANRRFSTSF